MWRCVGVRRDSVAFEVSAVMPTDVFLAGAPARAFKVGSYGSEATGVLRFAVFHFQISIFAHAGRRPAITEPHLSHPANSFSNTFPFRNHGRSTLCIYLGSVLFFAANFLVHSRASSLFPASLK